MKKKAFKLIAILTVPEQFMREMTILQYFIHEASEFQRYSDAVQACVDARLDFSVKHLKKYEE